MDRKSDPIVSELLAARKRIEDPNCWGQGVKPGGGMKPREDVNEKPRLCAALAFTPYEFTRSFIYLQHAMKTGNVPYWNDTHTHAEVLEAFDRAIALRVAEIS